MKTFNLIILTMGIVLALIIGLVNSMDIKKVDERTIILCKAWAEADHRKAIGFERYEKMHDLWNDYDWFESCLLNQGK